MIESGTSQAARISSIQDLWYSIRCSFGILCRVYQLESLWARTGDQSMDNLNLRDVVHFDDETACLILEGFKLVKGTGETNGAEISRLSRVYYDSGTSSVVFGIDGSLRRQSV